MRGPRTRLHQSDGVVRTVRLHRAQVRDSVIGALPSAFDSAWRTDMCSSTGRAKRRNELPPVGLEAVWRVVHQCTKHDICKCCLTCDAPSLRSPTRSSSGVALDRQDNVQREVKGSCRAFRTLTPCPVEPERTAAHGSQSGTSSSVEAILLRRMRHTTPRG